MNSQYVIIGGTTKAATTSLFEYLSAHPDICGSKFKESRFFLDENYPLEKKIPFGSIEQYNSLFDGCIDKRVRLEASPDYLYSHETPQKIKALIPNVKLIFIVREPVSRLVSWYKFAIQNNLLSATISFDEFVVMQQKPLPGYNKEQHFMALEQGKYAQYLRSYYDAFGQNNILILFYEDIESHLHNTIKQVCEFISINEQFYETFNFQIHNKTEKLKSPAFHNFYRSTRRGFRKLVPKSTFIGKWLRGKQKTIEPLYLKMNRDKRSTSVTISPETQFFLQSYYMGQKEALGNICGKQVPW